MNLVLEDTVEVVSTNQQNQLGMVVRSCVSSVAARLSLAHSRWFLQVSRGNSIILIEALEKL
jgi:small nuclear ribonucleoprotein (snRNP)-like protein